MTAHVMRIRQWLTWAERLVPVMIVAGAVSLSVLDLAATTIARDGRAPDHDHIVLIVVPKGTAYLQATSADTPMLPQLMTLRVGELDTIVIRNDDDFPVRVGPIRLAKGQQYRQRFRAAGDVQLVCATMYHREQVTVRVLPLREGLLPWLRNKVR